MTIYERFAQDYHAYHGISEERAREQLKVLRELEGHAGTPIEDVTADQVKSYLANLIALGGHPNTVRKKRGMILSFYGWAFDVRIVDADRFMRMKRTRNPRGATVLGVPNPYERREIQRFWTDLDAAWPPEDERFQQRFLKAKRGRGQRVNHYGKQRVSLHRAVRHGMRLQVVAISHLALHAGLRRNEIFKAPLADLHYDNGFVVVRYAARKDGNGNGEMRAVPMTEGLGQSLRAWLDWRAKLRPPHDSPWLRLTGVPDADRLLPMSSERIDHLLTDIGPGYGLHRMRHTCATEWLRAGVALELVSKMLGHATIGQTLGYAKLIQTDLEKGMTEAAVQFQTAVARFHEGEEKAA